MNKLPFLLLISICLTLPIQLAAQKVKKQTVKNEVYNYTEKFYVLKDNADVRHGEYVLVSRGKTIEKGQYANNEKTGMWEYYDFEGEVIQKYDWSQKKLIESNFPIEPGAEAKKKNPQLAQNAIYLGSFERIYMNLNRMMRYPAQARRMGIEGTVYVEFTVDEEGNVEEAKVLKGIGGGCDEEALRVIEQMEPRWLPALDHQGVPIKSTIVLPLKFQLG